MIGMQKFKTLGVAVALVGIVSVVPAGGVGRHTGNSGAEMSGASIESPAKADLTGKWDLNVTTDGGQISASADFKVASDGSITGTVESAAYGSSKISSGSVTDANFTVKFSISANGNAIEVSMSGTFDEKSIKGSGSAGDTSFSFTGTRASSAQ
jgi:hypothetical protein